MPAYISRFRKALFYLIVNEDEFFRDLSTTSPSWMIRLLMLQCFYIRNWQIIHCPFKEKKNLFEDPPFLVHGRFNFPKFLTWKLFQNLAG